MRTNVYAIEIYSMRGRTIKLDKLLWTYFYEDDDSDNDYISLSVMVDLILIMNLFKTNYFMTRYFIHALLHTVNRKYDVLVIDRQTSFFITNRHLSGIESSNIQ